MTIGITPFFASRGQEPSIANILKEIRHQSQEAQISAENIKKLHETLMIDIEFMNAKAVKYYDRKCQEPLSFREREKVWLLRRNK